MPLCARNENEGGGRTPTLDCALQPAPVEKGQRKLGFAIAVIAIFLMIRTAIRLKMKPHKKEVISTGDAFREPVLPHRLPSDQHRP